MPTVSRNRFHRLMSLRDYLRPKIPFIYLALLLLLGSVTLAWLIIPHHKSSETAQVYTVVGRPTINADFINRVLMRNHSPARGKGQALYNYGVKYGIDPAYALAFFMQESCFGTKGVATITHSLGNIRATRGHPQYAGYRYYSTWEEGFEDWYRLIAQQYVQQWGLYTVDQIIPTYAPRSDNNDEDAYIQAVKTAVNGWRSGEVIA